LAGDAAAAFGCTGAACAATAAPDPAVPDIAILIVLYPPRLDRSYIGFIGLSSVSIRTISETPELTSL